MGIYEHIGIFLFCLIVSLPFLFFRKKRKKGTIINGEYISLKDAIDKLGETTNWFDKINWYSDGSPWAIHPKKPTPFEYNREHLLRFVYRGFLCLYRDPRAIDTDQLPRWRKFCSWDEDADVVFEPKFRHSAQQLFVKLDELNNILENPDLWIEPRTGGCGGIAVSPTDTFDNSDQLNKG